MNKIFRILQNEVLKNIDIKGKVCYNGTVMRLIAEMNKFLILK